jgi:uncharacterized membrane protein YphA (DoxX/SURF4 family)
MNWAVDERRVVGTRPWLPWPLCGWRWWTEPVRAERLAAVRIGLALILLIDIATSYAPHVLDYFAGDWFGNTQVLGAYDWAESPRLNWSILRGIAHPLESAVFLTVWGLATAAIFLGMWGRLTVDPLTEPPARRGFGLLPSALLVWSLVSIPVMLGFWARSLPTEKQTLVWLGPLVLWMLATMFVMLEFGVRLRGFARAYDTRVAWLIGTAWVLTTLLVGAGLGLMKQGEGNPGIPGFLQPLIAPWNDSPAILIAAMALWIAATICLLVGFWSRTSAAVAWALALSFANMNPYIDNAGDTVRGIVLFYLMITPCGAVWSVDRWRERRRSGDARPVFIYPWALRLMFVQLAFIYFCNGLYKLLGADWREGQSLYYVLCDLTLSRVSFSQWPLPYWISQWMTWSVLAWEVGFPLWVAIPWTRKVALWFGVAFHVGILLTMEIGGFVPYMLVLYLPLLRWGRPLKLHGSPPLAASHAQIAREREAASG